MYSFIQRLLSAPILAGLLALTGGASAQITVATAANLRLAMEDMKIEFQKSTGLPAEAVYGASGALCAQIRNGAPFDVFLSADMDYPDSLFRWGYAAAKPRLYAYGKLVLWTRKDFALEKGISALKDPRVIRIALADPQRAPYGREAVKALIRAGLYDSLKPKLVYAENISQVIQYVASGNAEIGFVAKSLVAAGPESGRGKWQDLDTALYGRIAQGAVACAYGREKHGAESQRFLDFLSSPSSRRILSRYGYELPP